MGSTLSEENAILAYYQQIKDGTIIAGKWIIRWYEIIVHGLEEKLWSFDQKKAARAINFVERYCHHHEGPLAPQLVKLELWQRAFISVVFGIVDAEGRRQFREIVLVIARKQGKTAMLSHLSNYHLFIDGGYGARVYCCATKLDQAKLCYEGIYQTIRKEPTMDRLTRRRRTDLYIEANNASAKPLAFSAKKSDGLNISMGILDEFAAYEGDRGLKMAEVVKSSQGAWKEPLLFYASTANYIQGGLYDEVMRRCTAVLNGTSQETRLAPFLYQIDDSEKWDDINELRKAMPNLGVSVSVDYILEEIAVARGSLSKKAEFLTKYCTIQQNSSMAWLPAEAIKKAFGWSYTLSDFRDTYALGGIDLSQTTDLTACCALIQRDGVIWVFCQFFMPREKVPEAIARDGIPYDMMVQRGLLTLSGEHFVDYKDCFAWFRMLIEEYQIYPLAVGYDRYSAQYLVQEMERYGFHLESVFQGYNLTGVSDTFEGMLRAGLIRCADDNDLLKLHLMDAAQQIETGTNAHPRKKLVKVSKTAHVDGVAAILDAMCMRANHWTELGDRLSNEG